MSKLDYSIINHVYLMCEELKRKGIHPSILLVTQDDRAWLHKVSEGLYINPDGNFNIMNFGPYQLELVVLDPWSKNKTMVVGHQTVKEYEQQKST